MTLVLVIYAQCHYADCQDAECHSAEYHYAEFHYVECRYSECLVRLALTANIGLAKKWKQPIPLKDAPLG